MTDKNSKSTYTLLIMNKNILRSSQLYVTDLTNAANT